MEDLPPGFRFYPTEEELVSFYLHHKLEGSRPDLNLIMDRIIPVLDIYQYNPWQLPQMGGEILNREEEQWLFFVARQESEARGGRPKRITENGYWKATGSPGNVFSNNRIIGMKRTMVFYTGRAPNGTKTDWKMNEYKSIAQSPLDNSSSPPAPPMLRHEFSLCRVYKKSKSIRAFDRRPIGVETRGQTAGAPSDIPSSSSLAQNSPQSSSSGDHGANNNNPTQISHENASQLPMSIDTEPEPLWDWDQLEFYYGHDHN